MDINKQPYRRLFGLKNRKQKEKNTMILNFSS
jgi:hypothetical protein